ncbi:MAG TPA: tetratricopeptide repeat protein [Phycisphaerae bacterium]|nr:tetratricopeptide repeat protein [Phycisphaerae bacterium]
MSTAEAELSRAGVEREKFRWDWVTFVLLGVLGVFVAVTFSPAVKASFVDLDDQPYVFGNPHVLGGLTPGGVAWALTSRENGFYIPATWLSLQLDATISRLVAEDVAEHEVGSGRGGALPDATVYHVTNIVLHGVAAWMLFLFLYRATGERWAGFAVALLWAVHPLRVESVAWVTERKDEIAGVFGFLAMYWYVVGCEKGRRGGRVWFWSACGALVVSMWGKPMFTVMPVLLVVVDWWPLGRVRSVSEMKRAVVEKWPMWVVVVVGAVAAMMTSRRNGTLPISAWEKAGNAVLSYVRYMVMQVDFRELAVFYPYVGSPWMRVCGALGILAVVTVVVVWQRRRWPWLLGGWLWYVAGSLPTIGFVQSSSQAYADRFSYLGSVGLIGMVVFGVFQRRRATGAVVAGAVVAGVLGVVALGVVLAVFSYRQTQYWHDTITLFERAREVTPASTELHWPLAHGYARAGRLEESEREVRAVLAADPASSDAHLALAALAEHDGRMELALEEEKAAGAKESERFEVCKQYGMTLLKAGRYEEAAEELKKAAAKDPGDVEVREGLARAREFLR